MDQQFGRIQEGSMKTRSEPHRALRVFREQVLALSVGPNNLSATSSLALRSPMKFAFTTRFVMLDQSQLNDIYL